MSTSPTKNILALAYEAGLRRSETLLLKVGDVEDHVDYHKVYVRNSKSRPRIVLIIRYKETLRDWLRTHPWRSDPETYLFPAKTKDPYHPLGITT